MSINFVVGRTARFSMTEISTVTVAIIIHYNNYNECNLV